MINKPLLQQIGLRVLGVIALAVCIGIAFNGASPLGVRWAGQARGGRSDGHRYVPVPRDDPNGTKPSEMPPSITWAEAKQLLDADLAVLVDARPRTAYDLEHIPGAVSLPEKEMMDKMPDFIAQYGRDMPLIVYCSDIRCATSEYFARKLRKDYDFTNVMYLEGGFAAWQAAQGGAK